MSRPHPNGVSFLERSGARKDGYNAGIRRISQRPGTVAGGLRSILAIFMLKFRRNDIDARYHPAYEYFEEYFDVYPESN